MTAILLTIITKLGVGKLLIATGLGGGVLVLLAKKYIPNLFGDWLKSALAKELQPNLSNPEEKALFIDMVKGICRFVEYKIPDEPGEDKFDKVKAFLMRFVSEKYADDIVEIIIEAVKKMNDELKKAGQR